MSRPASNAVLNRVSYRCPKLEEEITLSGGDLEKALIIGRLFDFNRVRCACGDMHSLVVK
jgi:hypothetical protein